MVRTANLPWTTWTFYNVSMSEIFTPHAMLLWWQDSSSLCWRCAYNTQHRCMEIFCLKVIARVEIELKAVVSKLRWLVSTAMS